MSEFDANELLAATPEKDLPQLNWPAERERMARAQVRLDEDRRGASLIAACVLALVFLVGAVVGWTVAGLVR